MLFFQTALLGGYAYAHLLTKRFRPARQILIHLLLLAAAVATLPIIPRDAWKPDEAIHPSLDILILLLRDVGLPFFVLSATGPLLQHWFALVFPSRSPYRLYALSNAGSLLALLSYPVLFETHLTRRAQAILWGWGLVLFAIACAACGLKLWRSNAAQPNPTRGEPKGSPPKTTARILWVLWPFCASLLLLAVTNKLCQDVAVVPFLWVLPLSLYLLSFIICFDSPRWYSPFPFGLALMCALSGMCWLLLKGGSLSMRIQVLVYLAGLLICCMVCHGELFRLRPTTRHLTQFYLLIASGGALGGFFVALAAPKLFKSFYELDCGLLLCALLFTVTHGRPKLTAHEEDGVISQIRQYIIRAVPLTGTIALGAVLLFHNGRSKRDLVYNSRNFYGVLRVFEHNKTNSFDHHFLLQHGRITHGIQFADAEQALWPTSYYGEQSGIGLGIAALPAGPRRFGVVGLGTGSIAAYARRGDYLRIYEINPEVMHVAKSCFTYLRTCPARVDVVAGDARLSLERDPPQNFDLLALDAFTSDAIPVHLLTKEAFEVYGRHLRTNGIIAVHISNQYLDLEPVIKRLATKLNYNIAVIDYEEMEGDWWLYACTWVLLTHDEQILNLPAIHWASNTPKTNSVSFPLWTDDFASLLQVLK